MCIAAKVEAWLTAEVAAEHPYMMAQLEGRVASGVVSINEHVAARKERSLRPATQISRTVPRPQIFKGHSYSGKISTCSWFHWLAWMLLLLVRKWACEAGELRRSVGDTSEREAVTFWHAV